MKLFVAVIITLVTSPLVFADGEAEFKYRQGVMQATGGHMSSLVAILKGKVRFDNLGFHARGLADLAKVVPHVFPEGSGVRKSEALPAIWKEADEFKVRLDEFVEAANGMAAAADSNDMSAIGPAMNTLGQSCKGCHDDFREEHDH